MQKLLVVLLVVSVLPFCSGCTIVLGGIIGHQSAEIGAGLAIGAAIEFADDIAQALADVGKAFQNKSNFNAAQGSIVLPDNAFAPTGCRRSIGH